ncbi:CBU_0592 family membrane protein [Algirhabdus cladophorae]|uniref:CBU_0592 family membrane protein n=1 Tax=Algirhabdus cladophorae TaxID=3377108 RepID=UPI003B847141
MTFSTFTDLHFLEVAGVAGFCLYVVNYSLLTFKIISAGHKLFFALNGTAAALVLMGLMVSFNLASAMIQVFWITISIIGILIRLRPQKHVPTPLA